MYKYLLSLLFIITFFSKANAQGFGEKWKMHWDIKAHEKGQWHFAWGYGLPRLDNKVFSFNKDSIDYRISGFGPFHFKTEYGIRRNLSVQLSTTYVLYKSDWKGKRKDYFTGDSLLYTYGNKVADISANLRVNYHYYVDKNWDLYLGGGVGYNYFIPTDFTTYALEDSSFSSHFKVPLPQTFEFTAGIRYFFMTRTAIFCEIGYGKSMVQGGFVFKFRQKKRE
jgi:hypothetical protein